jgi:hypothetical protein
VNPHPDTTATYVYCLVRSPAPPSLSELPEGMPGTSGLRLIPVEDGFWLVAADAPLSSYGSEEIERRLSDIDWVSERALAHERVVEHFALQGAAPATVLPMKLFTLFHGDERAAAQIRERREEIERVLDRIAGRVEWGVRIHFREDEARRQALAAVQAAPDPSTPRPASGTSFLQRKKAEKESARDLAGRARIEVESAYDELARHAVEARRREPAPGEAGARLLLDAAFLVPSEDGEAFEAEIRRQADRLGPSCEVILTGPWPPYNFLGGAA